MREMKKRCIPQLHHDPSSSTRQDERSGYAEQSLDVDNFVEYLRVFYYGFEVTPFPQRLRYVPWSSKPKAQAAEYVGLNWGDNIVRIRARPSLDGIFSTEVNLEDILDAAIEMLPDDAYAIVLLVDHDMYESKEDDFCCGRACGGSRVAIVSSARYQPVLDEHAGVDNAHVWPASHCKDYVDELYARQGLAEAKTDDDLATTDDASPLRKAVDALTTTRSSTATDISGVWFGRLARTVSHELGHCLGLDHCVYYACNMQGTAGMAEDLRQPAYLCLVCLSQNCACCFCRATAWR